ncbi:DUF4258 domain-containing protein [Qipengyuania qiaonensis]|uniref:DUF4258 domain-containing protein n=1 Tax=Qipengyuania qiaonensis TaxID=2867240 RepID=A0ABS7J8V7_9SPHN|nr:DUF4258 domain-containing protein [Qipengyuania qiaonensis]MBX7482083.1 DUF4258 domain-containing protein [Qipengyuania qiaonensis]
MFTHHAEARMQQRGISHQAVDALMAYGEYRRHRGAEVCYLTKQSRSRMLKDMGKPAFMKLEKALDTYVVVSGEGAIITAGHRYHRLKF